MEAVPRPADFLPWASALWKLRGQGLPCFGAFITGQQSNTIILYIGIPDTQKTNPDTQETNLDTQKTNPDTQKTNPNTRKPNPETQKTNRDTQKTNPGTQKTNPDTPKTNPDTQKTIPSPHLTNPGTRLTSPGTRAQKIFENMQKNSIFYRDPAVRPAVIKSAPSAPSPEGVFEP